MPCRLPYCLSRAVQPSPLPLGACDWLMVPLSLSAPLPHPPREPSEKPGAPKQALPPCDVSRVIVGQRRPFYSEAYIIKAFYWTHYGGSQNQDRIKVGVRVGFCFGGLHPGTLWMPVSLKTIRRYWLATQCRGWDSLPLRNQSMRFCSRVGLDHSPEKRKLGLGDCLVEAVSVGWGFP